METAVLVVWWIGLIGALIATLVILKEVFLVIGALRDILRLAELTRDAAHGLVRNVHSIEQFAEVTDPALRFREATGKLAARATAVTQALDAVADVPEEA